MKSFTFFNTSRRLNYPTKNVVIEFDSSEVTVTAITSITYISYALLTLLTLFALFTSDKITYAAMAWSAVSRATGHILGAAGYIIQYGCITHCTFEYIGDFVMCSGPSMEPTLESDNVLLTEHITPRLQLLQRGDIVIARSPVNPKQNICKRITALPGDRVNGSLTRRSVVIPRGHVWLEGDNSNNSADSRIYGPVPLGLIRSRAVCRIWPIDKMQSLSSQ